MRIGIDATPLAVPFGGIHRYTERLIRALSVLDGVSEFRLYGPDGVLTVPFGGNAVWDPHRVPLRSFVELFFLPGARGSIDLFHGTNYTAPLLATSPTVLTVHDLSVYLFPQHHPFARRLRHRMLPLLCRRAARIIADSYCTKSDLVHHYDIPPEKIHVIYLAAGEEFHPISCNSTLEEVRRRFGLPSRFVLYVGAVEPRKNLPLLIRAMVRILREGGKHGLVITGGGDPAYLAKLRALVRSEGLEEGEHVRFIGCVNDRDLPALYSLCETFVYPSQYEGFGLPPLEAMACGAPVLIPGNSSFLEFYKDCGLMVDVERVGTLEIALLRLLRDQAMRDELVEHGFKLARSRTWTDVAAETLEVYRLAVA